MPLVERVRRRGSRGWVDDEGCVATGVREIREVLREGGPRNNEGGGARWGCAEEGFKLDMVGC